MEAGSVERDATFDGFDMITHEMLEDIADSMHMNSVDIADQLRNVYRPDGLWMKMRKWWWAFFLWCMGQSVVNGYLVYKRVCEGASVR